MATQTSRLKYLFGVLYRDGSTFRQTSEDRSETREGGSAFTDVRQDEVVRFGFEGDGRTVLVDLQDGHFELDGRVVWIGDDHQMLPPETPLRLIYFRRNQIMFNADLKQVGAQRVRYYLGWQATVDGRNYKAILGVD